MQSNSFSNTDVFQPYNDNYIHFNDKVQYNTDPVLNVLHHTLTARSLNGSHETLNDLHETQHTLPFTD